MRSLKAQVTDFLCCGGYRLARTAQETALARRRPYRRLDGEIDHRRVLFGDFSGFEAEEISGQVLVRFVGPEADEARALDGYARVLGNCGFPLMCDQDPRRPKRRAIRVSARSEIVNSPVVE